jgi:uncharacterized OB-fold protein
MAMVKSGDISDAKPSCGVEEQYRQAINKGCFQIQRCGGCEQYVFYPRELCPHCGANKLEWVKARGQGTVHAVTTVRRKVELGGDYNVSLIELDEKVRLMSRVEGIAPEEVTIGQRVRARVAIIDGQGLVIFDAVQEGDME